jgi:nucleotide-binding universal stress UspA family protein
MTQPEHRYVVVLGVDATPAADAVLAQAAATAHAHPGAELHLLHSVELVGEGGMTPLLDHAREYLSEVGRKLRDTCPSARIRTHLGAGAPSREIVQLAVDVGADLVVVATHGRGWFARTLLGSQAEAVVRKAPCPVLVVREKSETVPEIEPPCPQCLEVQRESRGASLWCARHAARHPAPHGHYEYPEAFGQGTMLLRPE